MQKGSQLLWKSPLFILSHGGWLCPGQFSSVGKMSGFSPTCFVAAAPFLVYLLLRFVLLDGEVFYQIPSGSGLRGVVPCLLWWFFLTSGFCLLHLLPSFLFEVEDLLVVEAQPIEVARSWMVEEGRRFGGLGGHCWRFSLKPKNNDVSICCRTGYEQVVRGVLLSPSSSFKVRGAFQNPLGLVLFRRVECKPVFSNFLILRLASCIKVEEGFISP